MPARASDTAPKLTATYDIHVLWRSTTWSTYRRAFPGKNERCEAKNGTPRNDESHRHFFRRSLFFKGRRLDQIDTDLLRAYRQNRKDKATKDRRKILDETTLNRDLALLRRMMVLTVREKKIQFTMPYFPMTSEAHNARQGFVDPAKFWELLDAIAEKLRPYLLFSYETGCRPEASRKIVWGWVNLDESVIYIPSNVTKTKDPLPVPLSEKLVAMLRKKFRTDGPVFDTTNFRRAFRSAADAVGLSEVIPYDLRRSAVRNMTRAGVDRSVAKKISGHKTDSVFERYNITSVEDVKKAMKQTSKYNASSIQVAVAGKKWIVVNASVLMV